jgi:hypothetical protein
MGEKSSGKMKGYRGKKRNDKETEKNGEIKRQKVKQSATKQTGRKLFISYQRRQPATSYH